MHLHGEREDPLRQDHWASGKTEAAVPISRRLQSSNGQPTNQHIISARDRGAALGEVQRGAPSKPDDNRSAIPMIIIFMHIISQHCLVQRDLLDYYLPTHLAQGNAVELLGKDKGLVLLVPVTDQLAQLCVDFQAPELDLLQHDDELLYHLVLYEIGQLQSKAGVKQLPEPCLVFLSELGASDFALAEGSCLVS